MRLRFNKLKFRDYIKETCLGGAVIYHARHAKNLMEFLVRIALGLIYQVLILLVCPIMVLIMLLICTEIR